MLFQQPAKLGVLRPQESLRVVHIAMIVDRDAARQDGRRERQPQDHLIRRPGMPPRTAQGAVVRKEIMRMLQRYIAREPYPLIVDALRPVPIDRLT
jgi:hypothetical protein